MPNYERDCRPLLRGHLLLFSVLYSFWVASTLTSERELTRELAEQLLAPSTRRSRPPERCSAAGDKQPENDGHVRRVTPYGFGEVRVRRKPRRLRSGHVC
jgi:hypothetical protein